jgi:hypothetical protein
MSERVVKRKARDSAVARGHYCFRLSASSSGAVKKRASLRAYRTTRDFEKELQPGIELSTRSLT